MIAGYRGHSDCFVASVLWKIFVTIFKTIVQPIESLNMPTLADRFGFIDPSENKYGK